MISDLLTALMLLTRLPVGGLSRPGHESGLARAVWAFPMVGLLVGAIGGLTYWVGHWLGLPPLLAAAWAFGVILLVTGAFHEDGFADVADGFCGGRTVERKLEILRDSRIGSYGALGLVWSCLVRVASIACIERPALVLSALIVAAVIGRGGMIVPLLMLKPARPDGIAASLVRLPGASVALALAMVVLVAFMIFPTWAALAAGVAGLLASLAMSWLARRQIGGHTGDVLGATEIVVECAVLTVLAALLR